MSNKTVLVCSTHQDKQLVYSWEKHGWVCPVCGGCNSMSAVQQNVQPTPESGGELPAIESNRKGSAPAKSG